MGNKGSFWHYNNIDIPIHNRVSVSMTHGEIGAGLKLKRLMGFRKMEGYKFSWRVSQSSVFKQLLKSNDQ